MWYCSFYVGEKITIMIMFYYDLAYNIWIYLPLEHFPHFFTLFTQYFSLVNQWIKDGKSCSALAWGRETLLHSYNWDIHRSSLSQSPSICLLRVNTTTASLVIWGKACSYPARLLSLSEFKYFGTRVRREQELLLALANIASLFHIPISSQLV